MGFAVLCNSACIQSLPRRSIYFNNQKHSQSSKLPQISRAFLVRKFTSTLFVTNFQVTDRKRACNSVFQRLPASLGNEVTIEEPSANTETGPNVDLGVDDPSKEDEDTDSSEAIMAESISPDYSSDSKQSKSTGSFRRNSNPQIKDEELVPGAIFTGKVRSIQSYGAFVELGASIQGLVHISRLSKDYVKNVSDIVSMGQEVTVKIVEANLESGRIALTMLLDDTKEQEGKKQDSDAMANHKGPARSSKNSDNDAQINSKFHKGQEFEGKVKAFVRSGALIELPENEEGFLPTSEVADDYTSLNGEMLLTRSQKVKVQVLRVDKRRIRLTMKLKKKEVRVLEENDVLVADNPFELAFRKHPVISAFLKEKESQLSKNSLDEASNLVVSPNDEDESSNNNLSFNPALENIQAKVSNESTGKDETSSLAASEGSVVSSDAKPEAQFLNAANDHNVVNGRYEDVNDVPDNRLKETPTSMPNTIANESISYGVSDTLDSTVNPYAVTKSERQESSPNKRESVTSTISLTLVKQLREETGAGMMNCKNALVETAGDLEKARDLLRKKGLASAEKKASRVAAEGRIGSYIHDNRIGVMLEVNCETDFVSREDIFRELVEDLAMQIAACPQVQYVAAEDVPDHIVQKEKEIEMQKEDLVSKPEQIREKIVEGRIRKIVNELTLLEQPYIKNDKLIIKDLVKQNIATLGENIQVRRFVRYNLGEGLEKKNQDFAAEVAAQTAGSPSVPIPLEGQKASEMSSTAADEAKSEQSKETVTISASLVRQLRAETGAGMMDCKKALSETGGDLVAAQEVLRKKGLASAEKKSGRIAAEGRVGSYIHDNRIGVLVELNCETDFVARGDAFKELVQDLAMQAVASPQTQCVSIDDIPKEIVDKEREIEMEKEDLQSKPEQIREKIVEGRLTKRLGELALLEQPFLRNDKILVKDVIKQSVATLGENIRLRRFVRYNLGEGVEKETKDLATEIAEQTKTTSEG